MTTRRWWEVDDGQVNGPVFEYVAQVESAQAELFDEFEKLATLYDPPHTGTQSYMTENLIASNVDTVYAVIAATEVRARFLTDDGDWSTQRTARHLELYAEGLDKLLGIDEACRRAFKDAALKGTGLVKVYIDAFDRICVERVLVDDIIVDETEVRAGKPRQMHERRFIDADVLKGAFPEHERAIERACSTGHGAGARFWADYRPIERNEVVVIESWRLPVGVEGMPGYQAGRHTICIDGQDLEDEKWTEDFFPFARMTWSDKDKGWYGIGLAKRIAGTQRALNKNNWHIDAQLDQHARPTTYVRPADANLAVKTISRLGCVAVVKADYPQTIIPPAVSAETYNRREVYKSAAFEESGVSRMAAQSMKPAGLDSGVALREYRDSTTQRFAQQEKSHERLKLDAITLSLWCCKKLGKKAPVIVRRSKHGPQFIPWAKVDLGEVRVQIAAASNLSRTPAGRQQLVLEWAQAGIVSQDEARRLMRHPDTERAMSLYTAALDDIERCIEEVLDGDIVVPEPYQNLQMGVWRFQQSYLKARGDGAPEEILENLRQWIDQAAYILAGGAEPANVNAGLEAGAPPMAPELAAGPPLPGGPPMEAPPQAALAAEAMNLRAV
jgi:hypothetical protein